jgi:hypothetical protein
MCTSQLLHFHLDFLGTYDVTGFDEAFNYALDLRLVGPLLRLPWDVLATWEHHYWSFRTETLAMGVGIALVALFARTVERTDYAPSAVTQVRRRARRAARIQQIADRAPADQLTMDEWRARVFPPTAAARLEHFA